MPFVWDESWECLDGDLGELIGSVMATHQIRRFRFRTCAKTSER